MQSSSACRGVYSSNKLVYQTVSRSSGNTWRTIPCSPLCRWWDLTGRLVPGQSNPHELLEQCQVIICSTLAGLSRECASVNMTVQDKMVLDTPAVPAQRLRPRPLSSVLHYSLLPCNLGLVRPHLPSATNSRRRCCRKRLPRPLGIPSRLVQDSDSGDDYVLCIQTSYCKCYRPTDLAGI